MMDPFDVDPGDLSTEPIRRRNTQSEIDEAEDQTHQQLPETDELRSAISTDIETLHMYEQLVTVLEASPVPGLASELHLIVSRGLASLTGPTYTGS